jgi:Mrp family chromosome partitioning ATPase
VLEDTEPDQIKLLSEIEREIARVCPEFMDMTLTIRHFAASKLSKRHNVIYGVTSALPGAGCTTVALSLAVALADIHGNVLYVEAEPSDEGALQSQSGYVATSGITGFLRQQATLDEAVLLTGKSGLSILPAGNSGHDFVPLERLTGMRSLFGTLRRQFDVTIVDLPPLLTSEDGPGLISELDGVVLVVSAGRTNIVDVRKSIALCGPVPVEGIMMNRTTRETPSWLARLFTSEGQRGLA